MEPIIDNNMNDYPNQKFQKSWVNQDINADVVRWAESFGRYLSEGNNALTTGQLRKFFGEVKRIETNPSAHKADIVMLKPLIAYAVGRDKDPKGNNKTKIKEFGEEISKGIDAVLDGEESSLKQNFGRFVKIFEAIVAYHKFYGAKE